MSFYKKVSILSHIITGLISLSITLCICIFCLFLTLGGFSWQDYLFLFVMTAVFYLFIFFPIDFILKNVAHLLKGDLSYNVKYYVDENELHIKDRYFSGVLRRGSSCLFIPFLVIVLYLLYLIVVLPLKLIPYIIIKICEDKSEEDDYEIEQIY